MPVSRSSVVVNHRVALTGTRSRGAVTTSRLRYIATRKGAVKDTDVARDGDLVSYVGGRPGAVNGPAGTALFDQLGPIALADARHELERATGAVCCTVISVRREDAEALRLSTKADWERYVRSQWQQEFSRMADIPEHRVRYVAAMHQNQPNNYHVHVLSWDASKDNAWDSLLQKRRMEDGRRRLTDKALAPEMERLSRERTLARELATREMRSIDLSREREAANLPKDGSLKYAHLERYHPDTAARIEEISMRARRSSEGVSGAISRHEEAVRAMGELKGLEGADLDAYVAKAADDLDRRLANATIDAITGERHARDVRERLAPDRGDRARTDLTQENDHDQEIPREEPMRRREFEPTAASREDMYREADPWQDDDIYREEVPWYAREPWYRDETLDGPEPSEDAAPSVERRREQALSEEISSMLTEEEVSEVLDAARGGRAVPTEALGRCPTIARGGATVAAEIASMAVDNDEGDRDTGSEIASDVAARGVRALAHHIVGLCAERETPQEGREIAREVTHGKEVDVDIDLDHDFGMDL